MFHLYFDESWDQNQQKILVIGGAIGRYEQWSKIQWPWKELLEKYGIDYYRATEAEQARKQFDKEPFRTGDQPLTKGQHDLLRTVRKEFFDVTTRGIVSGLAIGIPIKDFRQVANTAERLAKFGGTPYHLCGHIAMLRKLKAGKYEINSKELMSFIFDRQQQFDAEMVKVHSALASKDCEFHSQVGSIMFDDKRRFIPLQVADTLAFEARKDLERKMVNRNAPERPEFKRLKAEGKIFSIELCDKPCLEWYLEHMD